MLITVSQSWRWHLQTSTTQSANSNLSVHCLAFAEERLRSAVCVLALKESFSPSALRISGAQPVTISLSYWSLSAQIVQISWVVSSKRSPDCSKLLLFRIYCALSKTIRAADIFVASVFFFWLLNKRMHWPLTTPCKHCCTCWGAKPAVSASSRGKYVYGLFSRFLSLNLTRFDTMPSLSSAGICVCAAVRPYVLKSRQPQVDEQGMKTSQREMGAWNVCKHF